MPSGIQVSHYMARGESRDQHGSGISDLYLSRPLPGSAQIQGSRGPIWSLLLLYWVQNDFAHLLDVYSRAREVASRWVSHGTPSGGHTERGVRMYV